MLKLAGNGEICLELATVIAKQLLVFVKSFSLLRIGCLVLMSTAFRAPKKCNSDLVLPNNL